MRAWGVTLNGASEVPRFPGGTSLKSSQHLLLAVVSSLTAPVAALAQSPGFAAPLPVTASENFGTATNPALGELGGGKIGLSYVDQTGAKWIWDSASATVSASPVQGTRCVWGGSVLFCESTAYSEDLEDFVDRVRGRDFVTGTMQPASDVAPILRGLVQASGSRAVLELPDHTVRLVRYTGTSGSNMLKTTVALAAPNPSSRALSESFLFFQRKDASGEVSTRSMACRASVRIRTAAWDSGRPSRRGPRDPGGISETVGIRRGRGSLGSRCVW